MNRPLQVDDPELYDLVQKEKRRQFSGLELIASEVFHFFQRTLKEHHERKTRRWPRGLFFSFLYNWIQLDKKRPRAPLKAIRLATSWLCFWLMWTLPRASLKSLWSLTVSFVYARGEIFLCGWEGGDVPEGREDAECEACINCSWFVARINCEEDRVVP